ncbi:MAG TPA: phage minor head protein, partial [Spongiibacteraceae bacterium]|nr:phage minor head protein [Spongiibacteraceae bacterium]
EEHAGKFTVAKMGQLDLLSDTRDSLKEALAKGQTYRTWAKQLTPELQKRGWWGVQEATDPLTGQRALVQLGSPWRLKTIYDANLRTARQAGQWERIQRTASTHPYLIYLLGPSARHRPQHVAWAGTMLPIEDEFWQYAMPPNGWGCKCWVRQVSRVEYGRLRDRGYQDPLAPQELDDRTGLPTGRRVQQLLPVKIETPAVKYRSWVNRRTGEVERVVDGIDPGWDTNPGLAAQRQQLAREFMQSVNRAPAAAGAAAMAQTLPLIQGDLQNAYGEWVDTIASGALDGTGGRRTIGALSPQIVQALKQKVGVTPRTAGLTIEQREVSHLLADARKGDKALTVSQVRHLVHYLANPRAVIWDGGGKLPALLYVLEAEGGDTRLGRVAVRVDFARDGETINAIRSGARVAPANLSGPRMVRLDEGEAL